ncbi:Spore coat protein CotH [Asanoa hainanensis]|uniref:Spore coat protein CotH n=1 Tax=Asanoa hainanensis TaxID=560556 RepID=A0A239PC90_9ACTN|nr:CotH kinase family protein [Asanoa hainanensis]SNT64631.1 Spore coat protein CotH [Asanoa hainanensis]
MALRHRIPPRIRQYWKLLAACVVFLVVSAVVFSTVRVTPLVTSASDSTSDDVTQDIAGTTDLFDATKAHEITLTFRADDYQRLLDEYFEEGEKSFLEADVTVDGTALPSVGIRLKGNSTLSGLTRDGQARSGRFGQGRASLKAEEPENLPWLIRFDEFVDGRRYQGHREIAVRVAGMGGGSTVLNEALALDVLAATGQPAQRYAYSSFTVNDRPTTARLIVDHPDEGLPGGDGVLYKSLATSQFTDQGDDQTAYADDFEQITKKGSQDLQPVINLVKWVNSASDAEFDAKLGEHVDVAAFARYVAVQDLLMNFDDMAGPGRNYYLWYDLDTKTFTVVGWDYNLTFSSMGGGFRPPDGMEMPEGFQPPEGMERPDGGQRPGGGFDGMGGNKLKERFQASAAFKTVYEEAHRDLYQKIYGDGTALSSLDRIAKVLSTVGGYDAQQTTSDAEQLRTAIQQQTDSA